MDPYSLLTLNPGQKQFFDQNGYLVLEELFYPEEVAEMQDAMARLLANPDACDHRVHFTGDGQQGDDPGNPKRIQRIMDLPWADDLWFNVVVEPRIVDAMVDLLGPNINFHNGKAILKPAGHTNTQGWHQDFPYERHTSPDLAAAIVYLHDTKPGQGSTAVLPGSHLRGEWPHELRDGEYWYIPQEQVDPTQVVEIACKAGSVAFVHVQVVHRAGSNSSDHTKCAVINEYKTAEAKDIWGNRLAFAELPLRRGGQALGLI